MIVIRKIVHQGYGCVYHIGKRVLDTGSLIMLRYLYTIDKLGINEQQNETLDQKAPLKLFLFLIHQEYNEEKQANTCTTQLEEFEDSKSVNRQRTDI